MTFSHSFLTEDLKAHIKWELGALKEKKVKYHIIKIV